MERVISSEAPATTTTGLISVIVPTYKEVDNLRPLVERIAATMTAEGRHYEIVVVDDNSRDGTEGVMAELAAAGFPARLVTRVNQRGLSSAVIEGFRQARGEILVCMDADLSHPPEALGQLIVPVETAGADFVIGSRYVRGGGTEEGWGLFRWLNSKVATLMARPFTSARDPMAGFFALPRAVFERADSLSPIGYKIGLELIVKCRCRNVREVPIHFANRKFGQSKLSLREQINYIKHLKRLADYKYGWFSHLAQFCLVGVTGALVDLGTYKLLIVKLLAPLERALLATFPTGSFLADHAAGEALTLVAGLAIWVAMTWNFFLNRRLTFSHSRGGNALRQYWQFVVACSLGALVNLGIRVSLPAIIPFFNHYKLLAGAVGIVAGTVFNFALSHHWVFRRQETRE
ncbi:MAG: glycosyltransferase family 2 protein [Phycisphaerae bacterium]|jgi:dolichol-phosphate mannosyltransferase